jgi:exodeoxyribonuclease VII large subunit
LFENNLLYQFNQIEQNIALKIDRAKQNLVNLKRLLQSLDPQNVLKKGYALVKLKNKIISDVDQLQMGNEIETYIKNTKIVSIISSLE